MLRKDLLTTELCRPYLRAGEHLLDYGSGKGRLGALIRDTIAVRVTGVDITDYRETDIPLALYDGKQLPFSDETFDVSLAACVLHHHSDPELGIRELRRVTRRTVLVVEDAWTGWLNRWCLYVAEFLCNRWNSARIPLPYHFMRPEVWTDLFRKNRLRVIDERRFRYGLFWHVLFVLEPVREGSGLDRA
ncbi:MAG: class I SAM-dependent methyltransferase [bacterium]|nr:class I SAM-dependent methyltransferase [bacterium]